MKKLLFLLMLSTCAFGLSQTRVRPDYITGGYIVDTDGETSRARPDYVTGGWIID